MSLISAVGTQLVLELILESLSDTAHIFVLVIVSADVQHVDVVRVDLGWGWIVTRLISVHFWIISRMSVHSQSQERGCQSESKDVHHF